MAGNDLLYKVSHNKKFLFIVPNFIYIFTLLYYYNSNFEGMLEVLFSEVVIVSLVFFIITSIVYLFLMKVLNDPQKVFCIQCFICMFYFIKFDLIKFLLFIVFILILILDFKKLIRFKLDDIVCIVSFIIIVLFSYNFFIGISNVGYMLLNSKEYDNDISINVDKDINDTPNIYYIHCDGMMGLDAMKKYFNYNDVYLEYYFNKNGYYLNSDASLVAGHKTQRALVALFNPNYYDEFFGDYLYDLEDTFLEKKERTSFVVDFYELEEKRLDSELFRALDKKDYTTVGIGEFNAYTSLDTDYYYDYYYYGQHIRHIDGNNSELRVLGDNSDLMLRSYIRFVHSKSFVSSTMFANLVGDVNYLDYDVVDYNDFDVSEYKYINNAMENNNYWLSKAILKGLDLSLDIDNNKFVFVDFRLNHDPFTFNANGDVIDYIYQYNTDYYLGNYTYSAYLLADMLEFIKNNDEDAIIIVQGDHGLHTVANEHMIEYFDTDIEGIQDIRNSVISAIYIPDKYKNGDEKYLSNPLNISRYLVNNYVGDNYEYLN